MSAETNEAEQRLRVRAQMALEDQRLKRMEQQESALEPNPMQEVESKITHIPLIIEEQKGEDGGLVWLNPDGEGNTLKDAAFKGLMGATKEAMDMVYWYASSDWQRGESVDPEQVNEAVKPVHENLWKDVIPEIAGGLAMLSPYNFAGMRPGTYNVPQQHRLDAVRKTADYFDNLYEERFNEEQNYDSIVEGGLAGIIQVLPYAVGSLKLIQSLGVRSPWIANVGADIASGVMAFDPYDERLSNALIDMGVDNEFAHMLAVDENDDHLEALLKQVVEEIPMGFAGLGLGYAMGATWRGGKRGLRWFGRSGKRYIERMYRSHWRDKSLRQRLNNLPSSGAGHGEIKIAANDVARMRQFNDELASVREQWETLEEGSPSIAAARRYIKMIEGTDGDDILPSTKQMFDEAMQHLGIGDKAAKKLWDAGVKEAFDDLDLTAARHVADARQRAAQWVEQVEPGSNRYQKYSIEQALEEKAAVFRQKSPLNAIEEIDAPLAARLRRFIRSQDLQTRSDLDTAQAGALKLLQKAEDRWLEVSTSREFFDLPEKVRDGMLEDLDHIGRITPAHGRPFQPTVNAKAERMRRLAEVGVGERASLFDSTNRPSALNEQSAMKDLEKRQAKAARRRPFGRNNIFMLDEREIVQLQEAALWDDPVKAAQALAGRLDDDGKLVLGDGTNLLRMGSEDQGFDNVIATLADIYENAHPNLNKTMGLSDNSRIRRFYEMQKEGSRLVQNLGVLADENPAEYVRRLNGDLGNSGQYTLEAQLFALRAIERTLVETFIDQTEYLFRIGGGSYLEQAEYLQLMHTMSAFNARRRGFSTSIGRTLAFHRDTAVRLRTVRNQGSVWDPKRGEYTVSNIDKDFLDNLMRQEPNFHAMLKTAREAINTKGDRFFELEHLEDAIAVKWRGVTDFLTSFRYNNLLSSLYTHVKNTGSNFATMHYLPAERWLQAKFSGDDVLAGEMRMFYHDLYNGWATALAYARQAGKQGDSVLLPGQAATQLDLGTVRRGLTNPFEPMLDGADAWAARKGITSGDHGKLAQTMWTWGHTTLRHVDTVLGLPSKGLIAEDEFAKVLNYGAEGRRLIRRWLRETRPDLAGKEFTEEVERLIEELPRVYSRSDLTDPLVTKALKDMHEQAAEYARVATFTDEGSTLTKTLMRNARDHPWLRIFFPFIRATARLFRFAADRTPIISAALKKNETHLLRAIADGDKETIALIKAQQAMGSAIVGMSIVLYNMGWLRGNGPENPDSFDVWRMVGGAPATLTIPTPGDLLDVVIGVNNSDPFGMIMILTADIMTALDRVESEEQETEMVDFLATIIAAAQAMTNNKTFLDTAGNLWAAMREGGSGHASERLMQNLAVGFTVPHASNLRRIQQTRDPVIYELETYWDQVKYRFGMTEDIEPRLNLRGETQELGPGLGPFDIMNPYVRFVEPADETERWLSELQPSINLRRDFGTLGNVELPISWENHWKRLTNQPQVVTYRWGPDDGVDKVVTLWDHLEEYRVYAKEHDYTDVAQRKKVQEIVTAHRHAAEEQLLKDIADFAPELMKAIEYEKKLEMFEQGGVWEGIRIPTNVDMFETFINESERPDISNVPKAPKISTVSQE